MKKIFSTFFLTLLLISCSQKKESNTPETQKVNDFAIVIHGGAGTILKKNMTPEKEAAYKEKLKEAITIGYTILKNGGKSIDAVEQTIHVLENSPLFNAGKGAVFTHDETNELDASIMTGSDLNAGAVAGVKGVKNPISLARKVMEKSPHVMLSGKGAVVFAKEQGLELADSSYFYTDSRFKSLQRVKEKMKAQLDHDGKTAFYDPEIKDSKFGTVGCVALDTYGNITAGTSTGGMTNKRWNRIGDSPIVGSGTYANNETCGVSSTGWGEYFIRVQVAHDISALMDYKEMSLQDAAKEVIQNKLTKLGGTGGIIALDKNGNMVFEFNTAGMYRASMNQQGDLEVKIYKE
ncbi:isoaspartyl peptidase/L-asparaginase family protein [Tenacibaculum amylolyticum]|uniref:isoaspartyl peptidase/L-asparaginase family protein n=1 Tax=Tenacibaculum amylolyticum TaxID=104269 RepID=UPI003895AFFB